jgi:hypothetical protein
MQRNSTRRAFLICRSFFPLMGWALSLWEVASNQ